MSLHLSIAGSAVEGMADPSRVANPAGGRLVAEQGDDAAPCAARSGSRSHDSRRPIFRPVQYLGSKLRSIDAITSLIQDTAPAGGKVADLFSGSSVVSQGMASSGWLVTAVDAQRYSALFAEALLGVGRRPGKGLPMDALLATDQDRVPTMWRDLRTREDNLIVKRDAAGLRSFERALPLAWRSGCGHADEKVPLTSFYAGSYFGVRQAIAFDTIRHQLTACGRSLQPWTRAAALTALMHAASTVVHSAGKHFAQPLKERAANAAFLDKRLLSDRSLSVEAAFRSAWGAHRAGSAGP